MLSIIVVILNGVKNLIHQLLRSFTRAIAHFLPAFRMTNYISTPFVMLSIYEINL